MIDHLTDNAVIIEHKAMGQKWWNYQNNLPKPEHITQLWLYGWLYRTVHKINPRLILYYRAWGNYAELEITELDKGIGVAGVIDGKPLSNILATEPDGLRRQAEEWYLLDELPPVLDKRTEGLCTFRGKPSCPMYYHCWNS